MEQVSPRRRWRRSCLSPLARFEKFLAATDGSSSSADAVKVAIAMCVKSGAHLYPFNLVLTNPEYETLAPELVEKASEDARAHLEAIVAEAAHHGVGVTMVMRPGDRPDVEIVAAADEINADLIVMGQQGLRGLTRMMVGDATLRVIGSATCSSPLRGVDAMERPSPGCSRYGPQQHGGRGR